MKTKIPITTHEEMLPRIRRVAGQAQGIGRMIEDHQYCIDIITQIRAVRSALRAVELKILRKHMAQCVQAAVSSGSSRQAARKMEELLRVMQKQF